MTASQLVAIIFMILYLFEAHTNYQLRKFIKSLMEDE